MAGDRRDGLVRSVRTLYESGSLAGLDDAALLARYLDGGDGSEAAFGAIVARHGPMVLHACRSVARDDAEDAFQATFLVLARHASAVRKGASLGPWLFGVARRTALKARTREARRRDRERQVAGVSSYEPADASDEAAILLDEIGRLPTPYRDAIVLCHLQGLTYEAAARRLGCPLGTLSVRIRRGRERLRRALERRGVAPTFGPLALPGVLVPERWAEAAARLGGRAMSASPAVAPASVMDLAQGAFATMRTPRILATLTFCFMMAVGALAWRASADGPPQGEAPAPKYQLTGRVVDDRGDPAPGAEVQALTYDPATGKSSVKSARTDEQGGYTLDLPPGHVSHWSVIPPPGCWDPGRDSYRFTSFALSDAAPVHRVDYAVQRGTAWPFRFHRADGRPVGKVGVSALMKADAPAASKPHASADGDGQPVISFHGTDGRPVGAVDVDAPKALRTYAQVDGDGLAQLGLPPERGETHVSRVLEGLTFPPAGCTIRWDADFDPARVVSASRLAGKVRRFWLTDAEGRSAMLEEAGGSRFEPGLEGGRFAIDVTIPEEPSESLPAVAGTVVDAAGQPVADARVEVCFVDGTGSMMTDEDRCRTSTDGRGRFQLDRIPAVWNDRRPSAIRLVVTRDGYAGVDLPDVVFRRGEPVEVAPTVLQPEASLVGIVLDADGRPVVGAQVQPVGRYLAQAGCAWSGSDGRFKIGGLPAGPTRLAVRFGERSADCDKEYLASREPAPVTIRLSPGR